jgi:hypothetical protein
MSDLPEGFVDPQDIAEVTAVLDGVLAGSGPAGLFDLLARLPGVRMDPGAAKGFLRAAVPPSAWIGAENQLVLADAGPGGASLTLQHVVGGVTLAREALAPARTAEVVARLVSTAVRDHGNAQDASAALTAHRDLFGGP